MAVKTELLLTAVDKTKQAFDSVEKNAKQMEGSLRDGLNKIALSFGAAATAAAAMGAAMVDHGIEAATQIDNLSKKAGSTVEQFQKMAFGAQQFGIEQDKLADIIKDTNDKMGDFISTSGGAAKQFFDNIGTRVGITAEAFKGLSGPDALQLYYNTLQKANLSQQELTFYMEAISGDATSLIPLLRDGGAAMQEQANEAERLGIVLSQIDIIKLKQSGIEMQNVKKAFEGFGNQLAVQFSPLITRLSTEILDIVKNMGGFDEIAKVVFTNVVQGVGYAANAVRGLTVVWDGIKVAVVSGWEIVLTYFEDVEKMVRWVLEKIPGVHVSADAALTDLRQSLTNVREEFVSDLQNKLLEPLPYDGVIKWAEQATQVATDAAKKAAVAQAQSSLVGGAPATGENQNVDQAAEQALLQKIQNIKQASATELEVEQMKYDNRLALLDQALAGEVIKQSEYNDIKAQVEQQHQDRVTRIQNKAITDRNSWESASLRNQVQFSIGQFGSLFGAFAGHSKKMFELQKLANISKTVINTYDAAMSAYDALAPIPIVGPALGAAAAAAAIAFGLQQVQQIKAQSFGGGSGGGSSVPSANTAAATPITPATSTANTAPTAPTQVLHFNIEADGNYSGKQIRDLMEKIAEQTNLNVVF